MASSCFRYVGQPISVDGNMGDPRRFGQTVFAHAFQYDFDRLFEGNQMPGRNENGFDIAFGAHGRADDRRSVEAGINV